MSKATLVEPRVERSAPRLRGIGAQLQSRIDRSPMRAFLWLTLLYFAVVFSLSSLKLLWLDELITLHIARLNNISAIWHALVLGVDPNPPITYILVHLTRQIFGEHEFALRLPSAIGYWIGLLSLFLYLRRLLPAIWALGGTVLSMTMAAFDYSYESRSYAIFYGLAMLAFLCWSIAVDPTRSATRQRIALVGMTFALAAGISTNYFAVLAFLPIAAGEFTRAIRSAWNASQNPPEFSSTMRLRDFSIRIWVALAIAAIPLLFYRPLIDHSIAQFAPHAWNKVSLDQLADSYTEMVEIVLYPILALFAFSIVLGLLAHFLSPIGPVWRANLRPRWFVALIDRMPPRLLLPVYEIVAVFCLMAYPMLGYVIASIRGGMLSPRFVIPVCFGFAIAATLLSFQLFERVPQAGVIFLCLWLAWFLCRESVVGYWYAEQKQCFYKVLDHLPEAELAVPPGAPIVIPDPLMALTLQHYAPPQVAARVAFPIDFPAIRRYRHDDSPEQNFWAGRSTLYSLPILPLATFQHSAGDYLILASDSNWLLDDLSRHRYAVKRLDINTRSGALGGFTPLSHGATVFYVASGDKIFDGTSSPELVPVPFRASENLPEPKALPTDRQGE
ncbi:MAG TPA: glycosyltransferase family 39 protein [Edaphobacter sp.]|nr:glycosyltransferase family 39 protein [Edaphobacter sp.]